MVISMRNVLKWLRIVILFGALACMFFYSLRLFTDWITPVDHYRIPEGHAVKVIGGQALSEGTEHQMVLLERLRFFYWYGE
ncbi:YqzK family protein [Paenibacillus kribbensis]|uniref:YqzK family protein n=1 Tax=Paenibacillus kribbensis TaxID=172713 RepID=UPI0015B80FA5|nr:YqzK family protein [Paenibacillus kribbensis]